MAATGDTSRALLAAAGAGAAGRVVEHPFDTVKVRMQVSRGELLSLRSLYRGLPIPLSASALEVTTLFAVQNRASSQLASVGLPSWANTALSGGIAGLLAATILTPTELVKCRMQSDRGRVYRNSWHCLTRAVRETGPSVLFRGHTATLIREIPGTATWFLANERVLARLEHQSGEKRGWHSVVAGAAAGTCYTTVLFPADTVKTRIQTIPGPDRPPLGSVARTILRSRGIRGFYAGWLPAVLKSAPASAAIFGTYAYLSGVLSL
jgi:ornithine carrier protein